MIKPGIQARVMSSMQKLLIGVILCGASAFLYADNEDICSCAIISPPPPPTPDCSFKNTLNNNTQLTIAYGCSATISNNPELAQAVVAIYYPYNAAAGNIWDIHYKFLATATVIDHNWLLAAGHSLNFSYPDLALAPVYISPLNEDGTIPLDFSVGNLAPTPYKIKAIYNSTAYRQEESVFYADFSLLKTENALPNQFKPIPLLSKSISLTPGLKMLAAGFGSNESGVAPGTLQYRDMYFARDTYPLDGKLKNKNLGSIYVLGTKMEWYSGSTLAEPDKVVNDFAAWKLTGVGDSGSAIFYREDKTQKLYVAGDLTGGLVHNGAFFAFLPNPYAVYTSSQYWFDTIHTIISQPDIAVAAGVAKCVSASNEC